jgi:hypothetical protein
MNIRTRGVQAGWKIGETRRNARKINLGKGLMDLPAQFFPDSL